MYLPFQQKVDYKGYFNGKNRNINESQSDNDNFVINLDNEQEYKEDDKYKEDYFRIANSNEFKMGEPKLEQAQTKYFL